MAQALINRVMGLTMAIACVALAATAARAAPSCMGHVMVGSWNIEWLGRKDQRGSGVEQAPGDLAKYIKGSGVDVLAMQEISATHRDASGAARNRILDAAFAALSSTGARWKYVLHEKRPGSSNEQDQWTGAAWNETRVTQTGGPWRLPIQIDAAKEASLRAALGAASESDVVVMARWPQAMKFSAGSGKTDFVLVPLHLKSNRGGNITADIRAYEMQLVLKALADAAPTIADKDIVLLGDFNTIKGTEAAVTTATSAGFRDCNATNARTYLKGDSAPFDRILVRTDRPETAKACLPAGASGANQHFSVVKTQAWKPNAPEAQFIKDLSDHAMVKTGLCVRADDD